MKLSKFAQLNSVGYQTALRWFKEGKIEGAFKSLSGGIVVPDDYFTKHTANDRVVTYSRVSNQSRKKEMEYQVGRIRDFCAAQGLSISKEYKEVASGMNDNRTQLWKMLDSKPTKIVIENKDRLTRFGYNYLERLLRAQGCEIVCMNTNSSDKEDLMKDLVAIMTSFCCRLYGLRRGNTKAKKLSAEVADASD